MNGDRFNSNDDADNGDGIDKVVPNIDFSQPLHADRRPFAVESRYTHGQIGPHYNHHFYPDTKINGLENLINGY